MKIIRKNIIMKQKTLPVLSAILFILILTVMLTSVGMVYANDSSEPDIDPLSIEGNSQPTDDDIPPLSDDLQLILGDLPPTDPTDYSDSDNWFLIPEITKDVDTFFLYPTIFMDIDTEASDYMFVRANFMVRGVEEIYDFQACVFEESTNLFIPYYRQANIKIELLMDMVTGDLTDALAYRPSQEDIWAALDYYFENYNEGRPFIIAGHSQGAALVRLALKEYFKEHPEYYERMIAAYVLGFSITQDDLDQNPHLHFAEGADDTGVIVSWNTEGPGNKEKANLVVLDGAVCINPLNWKRDDTYASADENLGSLFYNPETKAYEIGDIQADAQVDTDRGVVVCTTTVAPFIQNCMQFDMIESSVLGTFGPESFHNGDYSFYFNNIKENVRTRIEAWNREHK